ncbi:hypothetical protein [Streptomyces antimycoticus]|uniref:Metallo-beta-lactamase domain-containing protein n=1 Tax=Streptomyces antimycoticus TaxID=68175 RepID=A0A4D4KLI0_9ACTN|nr:hypothetical protein SANT12839_081900 [Streptomyces antimycoticus]
MIDIGGLRIVSDPTFDEAGPHGYLTKTAGPAVDEDGVGPVDLVLITNDTHPDNLDERGRAFAETARLVLGTGVFGGFTPLIALSLTTSTGNQLAGVAYPITTAAMSALVSLSCCAKAGTTDSSAPCGTSSAHPSGRASRRGRSIAPPPPADGCTHVGSTLRASPDPGLPPGSAARLRSDRFGAK